MSWHWQATWADGADPGAETADELAARFPSQGEAESWLGEAYPDLAAAGVTAVTLYEEDRLVYGPMDLSAS